MFKYFYPAGLAIPGTDIASNWDVLYYFLLWLSVFFFVLVIGAMIYFGFKYRDRPGIKTKYITGNHTLEAIWIGVPTVLLLVIFAWGYSIYHDMVSAPSDAYEVHVIGKQWMWQFQYDNGKVTTGELYVPLGKPVKLIATSQDVLHGMFIPNFRVKSDVVPGMYTSIWFEATVPGRHQMFCTAYCGTSHSGMLASVIVLDAKQWKEWNDGKKIEEQPDARSYLTEAAKGSSSEAFASPVERSVATLTPMAMQGKHLFEVKGCAACHSPGENKIGPSYKGLYGSTRELADGHTVVADENYIRESIVNPAAKIVKGYNPVMPTFQGQLNETDMNSLIAFIKSQK